ncbi:MULTISPECIES: hypothetical protein [Halococcus]|uniref:hypothetical protein n=1 Tax=Halococcus TaxID=2249 RepID=UPI000E76ACED|nr:MULTISPECIES: hypothetical protein [Halococcus]RJT04096.1 hypothetical protein D3261_10000 [Halococcus sp. IIIV-5B]
MRPRTKSGLLWGVIGALGFLVLVQAAELGGGLGIGLTPKLGLAVVVGVVTAATSYVLETWLVRSERA